MYGDQYYKKDLKQQIKRFRYRFELQIKQVHLTLPFQCNVYIEWGKKNKKVKSMCTLQKITTNQNTNKLSKIRTNSKLFLEQWLYMSKNQRELHEKQNFIKIILQKDQNQKLGGIVRFNIAQSIQINALNGQGNFLCRVQNSPDQNALLKFKVSYQSIKEQTYLQSNLSRRKSPETLNSRSPEGLKKRNNLEAGKSNNQFPYNPSHLGQVSFTSQKQERKSQFTSPPKNNFAFDQRSQKIAQLQSVITSFKNQLHLKTKQIQTLRDQNILQFQQIQQQRIHCNEKLLKSVNELNLLQDKNRSLNLLNYQLNKQIEKLNCHIIKIQKKNYQLQNIIESLKEQKNEIIRSYQEQKVKFQVQNQKVKYSNFEIQSKIFNLQKQIQRNQQPDLKLKQKYSKLQYQNTTLSRQIKQYQSQIRSYQTKIQQLTQGLKQKRIEGAIAKQKLSKIQKSSIKEQQYSYQAYVFLKEKFENLRQQMEQKEIQIQSFNATLSEAMKQKDKQLQFLRRKFDFLRQKTDFYQQAEKKQTFLQSKYDTSIIKNQLLSKENEELKKKRKLIEQRLEIKERQLNSNIQNQQKKNQMKLKQFQQTMQTVAKLKQKFDEQLEQKNQEIQRLNAKVLEIFEQTKKYSLSNFTQERHKKEIEQLRYIISMRDAELSTKQFQNRVLKSQLEERKKQSFQVKRESLKPQSRPFMMITSDYK